MSVLSTVEAVPSRLLGVVRYLQSCPGFRVNRECLEAALSPPSLRSPTEHGQAGGIIRRVLAECRRARLVDIAEEEVQLADDLRSGREAQWADILEERLLDPGQPENDFGRALTWLVAQNPYRVYGDYPGYLRLLLDQVGESRLELGNKAPWDNLCYWAAFLGYGWAHRIASSSTTTELFVPDPTAAIARRLAHLFPEGPGTNVPVWDVQARLARVCPVFPGGAIYEPMRPLLPEVEHGHLPPALSLAWLRLEAVGKVQLVHISDGDEAILADAGSYRGITHVRMKGKGSNGA